MGLYSLFSSPLSANLNFLNLKLFGLIGLAGISLTVGGVVSSQGSKENLFDISSISLINKKLSPFAGQLVSGANNLGPGLEEIRKLYLNNQEKIGKWTKENVKFSKFRDGLKDISEILPNWAEKTYGFAKNLPPLIKDRAFGDWNSQREKIFAANKYAKEFLIPALKILYQDLGKGRDSRISRLITTLGNKEAMDNLGAFSEAYSNNKEAFSGMSVDEWSRVMDAFLKNPKEFAEQTQKLNSFSSSSGKPLDKNQILKILESKDFPTVIRKTLSESIRTTARLFKGIIDTLISSEKQN